MIGPDPKSTANQRKTAVAARHREITHDLREENRSLQEMLVGISSEKWSTPTPAAGWNVQDQVNHLAFFDEATVLAATDPDRFRRQAAELTAPGGDFPDRLVRGQRDLTPAQTAAWFTQARDGLIAVAAHAEPGRRLPWYGPDMSVTSAVTARLMETWAHGQDIADALGIIRTPTDRLRHVAHLGVATKAFSFQLRGMAVPDDDVAVQLAAPDGDVWRWGDPRAQQRITGPALDFCLVVTQRRHLTDTSLSVIGDVAVQWMSLAQAYAGVPGSGRPPLDHHDEKETG